MPGPRSFLGFKAKQVGAAVHTSNPRMAGLLEPGQHGKTISAKNTKNEPRMLYVPVVPASQEAEAGGSLEPMRSSMQQAMIMLLHSSLSNRRRPCLRKKSVQVLLGQKDQGPLTHCRVSLPS